MREGKRDGGARGGGGGGLKERLILFCSGQVHNNGVKSVSK